MRRFAITTTARLGSPYPPLEALERARKRIVEEPKAAPKPLLLPTDLSGRLMVSDRRFRK
jgi:hypothetical protein